MEYQHRRLLLPGIVLACLLILPAAGAALVSDSQGGIIRTPQQECPYPPGNHGSSGTIALSPGEYALKATAEGPALSGPSSLQAPFAQGTITAWVNQNSMQGNANSVVSSIEYHQKVTATGQITAFYFSASVVC